MHHIASDGWSLVLFFKELSAIYEALSRGEQTRCRTSRCSTPTTRPGNANGFRETCSNQLSYWTRQLGGDFRPAIADRSPAARDANFQWRARMAGPSEPLTTSLLALSQREGVTLFITLLAAFKTLLHRYTRRRRHHRRLADRESPADRNRVDYRLFPEQFGTSLRSFGQSELSRNARARPENCARSVCDQDVPFEKLIEALKPERDLSRTPIFQVYFNLFNFADEIKLPEAPTPFLCRGLGETEEALSKFDLTLYAGLQDRRTQTRVCLQHRPLRCGDDRADAGPLSKAADRDRRDPDRGIADFSLRGELKTTRVAAVRGVRPVNPFIEFRHEEIEQSITQRFATQVEKYPNRLAVSSKNHGWTYQELDAAVHSISQTLAGRRGNGEERVTLLFEHDAPMLAAMLGALEAGKTYVPLDPASPVPAAGPNHRTLASDSYPDE